MNRCRSTGKREYATAQEGWNALKRRTDAKARSTHQQIITRATNRHAHRDWPVLRNTVLERDFIEREREREVGV